MRRYRKLGQKLKAEREHEEHDRLRQALDDQFTEPPAHITTAYKHLEANPFLKDRWRMNPGVGYLVECAYGWGPHDIVLANKIVHDVLTEYVDTPNTKEGAQTIIDIIRDRCQAANPEGF